MPALFPVSNMIKKGLFNANLIDGVSRDSNIFSYFFLFPRYFRYKAVVHENTSFVQVQCSSGFVPVNKCIGVCPHVMCEML